MRRPKEQTKRNDRANRSTKTSAKTARPIPTPKADQKFGQTKPPHTQNDQSKIKDARNRRQAGRSKTNAINKGGRNRIERGASKAKGDTKGQSETNPQFIRPCRKNSIVLTGAPRPRVQVSFLPFSLFSFICFSFTLTFFLSFVFFRFIIFSAVFFIYECRRKCEVSDPEVCENGNSGTSNDGASSKWPFCHTTDSAGLSIRARDESGKARKAKTQKRKVDKSDFGENGHGLRPTLAPHR